MATKVETIETVVCDLHESEHEGVETVPFALDGTNYSIDLCEQGAERIRRALTPFTEAAQVVPARAAKNGTKAASNGHAAKADNDQIRAWARNKGWEVADRGRISGEIIMAYKDAHKRTRAGASA